MKNLLIALLMVSSIAYAAEDCSSTAQTVVDRMHKHNASMVQINYSADQTAKFNACKQAIKALDSSLVVVQNPVSGNSVFKFEKAVKPVNPDKSSQ
ncbi:MAG: hypothetical protein KBD37_00735 [Burkholderiales bacterium]|nr:hypothetical protein [Burkholderiales bacterium]